MRRSISGLYPMLLVLPALAGVGGAAAAALFPPLIGADSAAADGEVFVRQNCAGCHAVDAIDYVALGVQERLEREAPPLYYAGNKYREQWLVEWLQEPEAIHPAGYLRLEVLQSTNADDSVTNEDIVDHPALSEDEAEEAADYLMSLRPHDDLLEATGYSPAEPAMRMAMMHFRRFNACSACHRDEDGSGGVSGPELYTAGERLQPRFIASFLAEPMAWDPYSGMPSSGLNPDAVHRLADYLLMISEE